MNVTFKLKVIVLGTALAPFILLQGCLLEKMHFKFNLTPAMTGGLAGEQKVQVFDRLWTLSASEDLDKVTWEILINDQTLIEPQNIERKLPSKVRGSADPSDTPPLILRTQFDHPVIMGFFVRKATPWTRSQSMAVFDIRINDELHHRKKWPWTERDDGIVDQLYYVHIPAGESTLTLEVLGGYRLAEVDISNYYIADTVNKLPESAVKLSKNSHTPLENTLLKGYHGIWYEHEQPSEYGDKYSGGLGTYTSNHLPLAIYVDEVDKTFFVYGGTVPVETVTATGNLVDYQHVSMIGSFDHRTEQVSRPTVVYETHGVNDPHFNPTLSIDTDGKLLVFVSGRAFGRPGYIYRSIEPYNTNSFERIYTGTMNYPQPWLMPDGSLFLTFTKYTDGRTIYGQSNSDGSGIEWSESQQLLRMGGHYAISRPHDEMLGVSANYHIGGSPDRRTNLYYLQTIDGGKNWTTVDGELLSPPLTDPESPARVVDYESEGLFVYLMDMAFDKEGHPVIIYVTTHGHEPGPPNDPRNWHMTRWDGDNWHSSKILTSDHNYDVASLNLDEDMWRIIGPGRSGPQPYQTGGEIDVWTSTDKGQTWSHEHKMTTDSQYNHTYVRRPVGAKDPFYAFWADGDPTEFSESRLYFGDSEGRVWKLPTEMSDDWVPPALLIDGQ